ncbi:T9SS type A sorting domain-containing protein [Reichenbachiella sp.]
MKYYFLTLLLFISLSTFSQKYQEMISKGSYSVFQIQEEAESYFDQVGRSKGTGYKPYKRWEYNAIRTMNQFGMLKSSRYLFDEIQKVKSAKEKSNARTLSNVGEWEELGPTDWHATSGWNPGVGRITSFSVDPSDTKHIIVGSQTGGVWKTTDEGETWTVLTDDFTNLRVYALAMDPIDTDIYYWGSTNGTIYKSIDAGVSWESLGMIAGGTVNKILIDPENSNKMFASLDYAGIFQSTDAGETWTIIHPLATRGYDVVFKPGDTNTIYASGEHFFISTDGGNSFTSSVDLTEWTQEQINYNSSWHIANKTYSGNISPISGQGMALFYSNDIGAQTRLVSESFDLSEATDPKLYFSFTQEVWGEDQDELKVLYRQASDESWVTIAHYTENIDAWQAVGLTLPNVSSEYQIAFEGTYNYGFGITLDNILIEDETLGVVFEEKFESDLPFSSGIKMVGVSTDDPDRVYVLEADNNKFGAFYRSNDNGESFEKLDQGGKNYFGYTSDGTDERGQAPRDMAIAINPSNADEVHIAGILTWRSTDGGTSFNVTSQWVPQYAQDENIGYCHADVDIMQFVGRTLYVGSDGGIFLAENTGSVNTSYYRDITSGMGIRQLYKLGISQNSNTIISAGSQDNGTSMYDTNGQWNNWLGADGMETFVDKLNSNILYGTSQNGKLYRSEDGGKSYFSLGSPEDKTGNWVTPFEQDPVNPNTLYAGYEQIYKSSDKGESWSSISQTLEYNANNLKISASNNQIMYATTYYTLYGTKDGGSTDWSELFTLDYSQGYFNFIAVHPTNPLKIAAAITGSEKVIVSEDGGNTWKDMTLNLPNFSALCLTWHNNGNNGLYLGMNYGIYYIDDTLDEWESFDMGLPNVQINELEINTITNKIFAATYGRGIWVADIYAQKQIEKEVCMGSSYTYVDGTVSNNITTNESHQSLIAGVAINGLDSLVTETLKVISINNSLDVSENIISAIQTDASYQWLDCNDNLSVISGKTEQSFEPQISGQYAVEITYKGCTSISSCENIEVLGVIESSFDHQIILYPNPTQGLLIVEFNHLIEGATIEIRNISGQLLEEYQIQNTQSHQVNLDYPRGTYLINITSEDKRAQLKVLKN